MATDHIIGNMVESELREYVRDHFDELLPLDLRDWSFEPPPESSGGDVLLNIKTAAGSLRAACQFKAVVTRAKVTGLGEWASSIRESTEYIPLLLAVYLSQPLQDYCRKVGLPYLDLSGNAWIEHPALVIHRSSVPPRFRTPRLARSPFADRASLILRLLFTEGRAGGVRELARSTGLNPGYTSRIVKAGVELGYLRVRRDRSIQLLAPEDVLGDWVSVYTWNRNQAYHYNLPGDEAAGALHAYIRERRNVALTMQAGANLIDRYATYHGWHIYCESASIQSAIVNDLGLDEVPAGAGNVILMQPYYRESTFYGLQFPERMPVVSDLQLYLDLFRFPARGRETAERIRRNRLLPRLRIDG